MKKAPFEIIRKEIDDSHYYWIDGEFVPAVTAILDESGPVEFGLRNFWKQNSASEADKKMNDAGDFGSMMHDLYERLLNGEEIDMKKFILPDGTLYRDVKKAQKHLMSFHDWFHSFKPDLKSIQTEFTVGSKKYQYAGTLDLACTKHIGKNKVEVWIIDFKTSAGIYSNHERQVAAYKKAYEEMTNVKVSHTAILRTGSQHKCGYEFKEVDRPFQSFLNVYKTFVDDNGGKVPNPPEVNVYPETLRLIEKRNKK